jgi:hypothetical protein
MSAALIQSVVSLPESPFPLLAVGFMGLGTGYLIYGPQELQVHAAALTASMQAGSCGTGG